VDSAELQYSQLAEHHFHTEAVGAARLHLVTPPQEMPYALVGGTSAMEPGPRRMGRLTTTFMGEQLYRP
jgi:hypothetical protein